MSANDSGTPTGSLSPREAELRAAKARLEAKALRLEAEALQLEAELEKVRQQGESPADSKNAPAASASESKSTEATAPKKNGHAEAKSKTQPVQAKRSSPPAKAPVLPHAAVPKDPQPTSEKLPHGDGQPDASKPRYSTSAKETSKRLTALEGRNGTQKRPQPPIAPPSAKAQSPAGQPAEPDEKPARREKPSPSPPPVSDVKPAAAGATITAANDSAVASPPTPDSKKPAAPKSRSRPPNRPQPPAGADKVAVSDGGKVHQPPAIAESAAADDAADAGAEPVDHQPAAEPSRGGRLVLLAMPSWLVSLLFHVIAILLLALSSFAVPELREEIFTLGDVDQQDQIEELEEVVFEEHEVQIENTTFDAPAMDDPGLASFGDVTSPVSDATVSEVGNVDTSDTAMVDVGQLFGEDGAGMSVSDAGQGAAEFFGVKSTGRVFVFCVDSSLSMKNGKFEAALYELVSAIRKLKPDQYFYVIFFDWDALAMFDKEQPEPRPLPATPENIARLQRWLPTVELELKTTPYASVKMGFEFHPDAIYLLTDGQFNDQTQKYLRQNNKIDDPAVDYPYKTIVHTIGFYSDQGRELLFNIAQENGGTYRFVPDPRKARKKKR